VKNPTGFRELAWLRFERILATLIKVV